VSCDGASLFIFNPKIVVKKSFLLKMIKKGWLQSSKYAIG